MHKNLRPNPKIFDFDYDLNNYNLQNVGNELKLNGPFCSLNNGCSTNRFSFYDYH